MENTGKRCNNKINGYGRGAEIKSGKRVKNEAKRHDRLWFYLILLFYLLIGVAAAFKSALWIVLGAELLIFLSAALLPFCKKRECLWVSVLTVMAWGPWNTGIVYSYIISAWAGYPGWVEIIMWMQTTAMLVCTEVLAFGLLARALWRHQAVLRNGGVGL